VFRVGHHSKGYKVDFAGSHMIGFQIASMEDSMDRHMADLLGSQLVGQMDKFGRVESSKISD